MSRETTRTTINLTKSNVAWYYDTFPGGSLSASLDMLLTQFRAVMDHTPEEYARIAAEELVEKMRKKS